MDSSVSPKLEIWFLRVCHRISTGLYYKQPLTLPAMMMMITSSSSSTRSLSYDRSMVSSTATSETRRRVTRLLVADVSGQTCWSLTFKSLNVQLLNVSKLQVLIFDEKKDIKGRHRKCRRCDFKLILKKVGLRMWPTSTRLRMEFRERLL